MDENLETVMQLQFKHYLRNSSKHMGYGTAGFRDKASELNHVLYRMGLLAVLRSKAKLGATIGIMITASHNPEEDNGVKLCDPCGDMLPMGWEDLATKLANVENENLKSMLVNIIESNHIDYSIPANVYLAKDTRSSSTSLANAALDGIKALNGQVKDFGLLTTPQLHYVVCCKNNNGYGTDTEEGYFKKLSEAFEKLRANKMTGDTNYKPFIYVDCANGVGAHKLEKMATYLPSLTMELFNDCKDGILNYMCGADYVKIQQKPPEGTSILPERRYASIDGDADRLIYFYIDQQNVFHMLDGDKIASLFSKYLKELVASIGLKFEMKVVQTAYANGSSTAYIENELKIPVVCVPTGVKHLHHEAKQSDIGVYFEANGHGTIVFSDKAKSEICGLASSKSDENRHKIMAKKLLNFINLVNETVGDAISDLLLIETILCDLGWSIEDWDKLYSDVPSRQLKVVVADRSAIVTTNASRICVAPDGLQTAIDFLVEKYKKGRSFVRPSGTEDVVRVYAEAISQVNADELAREVALVVKKLTS